MLRYYYISVLICLSAILFFNSCHRKQGAVQVKIARLEQSLFTIPVDSIPASIPRLEKQYGELLDLYSNGVIYIGSPKNPEYPEELTKFLTDTTMNLVYKRIMEVYPNLKDVETGLSKAFSNYRNTFPNRVIPSVYTLMSGFNQSMITADSILAIALDKYLGKNEEMYFMLGIANYQRQTMDRKYLATDCMKAWLYSEFPQNDSIDNVLSNILYEGKIMYAMRQIFPQTPDSLIFGYTPVQMQWCRNNTAQMWSFMVEKKMLYNTDQLNISKLVGQAPYTSLFTRESPGRAAVWLVYQIIDSYMKHNKTTLEALLLNKDDQYILSKAKFRP